MIKKESGGFTLYSKDGSKRLSKKGISKEAALKREREVQYFKHMSKALENLSDLLTVAHRVATMPEAIQKDFLSTEDGKAFSKSFEQATNLMKLLKETKAESLSKSADFLKNWESAKPSTKD